MARDLLPHVRRANFEDKMPTTARKHRLQARSVMNSANNASHVQIETTLGASKLVLTSLYSQNGFDLTKVRSAQFRKSNAEMAWLFEEFNNAGDTYYGLILYSASARNKERLDFAYLAFPTASCEGWFGRYDLYELAGATSCIEVIEDKATPKLRKEIIRKEK